MSIRVARAGALTTVQDRGRRGWQHDGVPVSGAMDDVAMRTANWLVGNDAGAAVLEATIAGPSLEVDEDTTFAITGADMDARLHGLRIRPWHTVRVRAGETLTLDGARRGCRAYIAVAGGIAVAPTLGSRSTYARAGFGGYHGRPLERGDVLAVGKARSSIRDMRPRGIDLRRLDLNRHTVRLVPGPHWRALTGESRLALAEGRYTLTSGSDRMGFRFAGEPLRLACDVDVLSAGVTTGTMQLPPDGQPIVLMTDRQTTGGYPRIGEIATVDLPILAQLRPGDSIRVEAIPHQEAERLYLARECELDCLRRLLAMPG